MRWISVAALAALTLSVAQAHGEDFLAPDRFAAGLSVGSNGVVAEGSYKASPHVVLRAQGAFLDFNDTFNSSDVRYHGDFKFNTAGGFLDLHPFANAFLLSAGVVGGERKVSVVATPSVTGSIKINGVLYPVTEVGAVEGDIDFGSPDPFVGLGWDTTHFGAGRWGIRAIAGVVFGDTPKVRLTAVGPFAANPEVLSSLIAEETSLQKDAGDYRYYPIAQIGLTYRF